MEESGRISVHPRGFGFLNLTNGSSAFVAPPELNRFLLDDFVSAEVATAPDGRCSATRLRLLERPRERVFGEVVWHRKQLYLHVDREVSNTDWLLEADGIDLRSGDIVVARVEDGRLLAERCLSEDADVPLERLIVRYGLLPDYGADALIEAAAVPDQAVVGTRRDLRDVPTLTVDGPSTRDIDDAVSVLPATSDGALRLLVSIADPAEYVKPGTALDREARRRGTTVYLPGHVFPMLPEVLSADRLSLWPDVDRPALTVELRIDAEGHVTATDLHESVIRSRARLTYQEVQDFLDRGEVSPAMEPVREVMPWLRTAAARLSLARTQRGGLSLAREEAHLTLDDQGEAVESSAHATTAANQMIERFMVATNEAVGRWLEDRGVPGLYRVHPEPAPERVADLSACAHNFGYEAGFPRLLTPLALSAFDSQIAGTPAEPAVRSVMFRALGPARYTVVPGLHFGLAAPRYLHFTSPLRRYADLAVHRTIKRYLRGDRGFIPLDPEVEALASHLNERTRAAGKAETDRHRMLVARMMSRHIGETFSARITRIRPFGLVAQIDASLVEGLIPLESLPDGPYQADPRDIALIGRYDTFTIGMPVTVRVRSTDPVQGKIDYDLVQH